VEHLVSHLEMKGVRYVMKYHTKQSAHKRVLWKKKLFDRPGDSSQVAGSVTSFHDICIIDLLKIDPPHTNKVCTKEFSWLSSVSQMGINGRTDESQFPFK